MPGRWLTKSAGKFFWHCQLKVVFPKSFRNTENHTTISRLQKSQFWCLLICSWFLRSLLAENHSGLDNFVENILILQKPGFAQIHDIFQMKLFHKIGPNWGFWHNFAHFYNYIGIILVKKCIMENVLWWFVQKPS